MLDLEQEREKHGHIDRLAILRHARRLKAICGQGHAIKVLEEAMRDVSSPSIFSDLHIGR